MAQGERRDDRALIAAHLAGDPTAFTTLIHRHHAHLWSVAIRTTRDLDDAADALQDALIKAHQMAHTYRSDSKVSVWLHRITVNASLDRLRRNKSRATVPFPDLDSSPLADPIDFTTNIDLSLSIGSALNELPEPQRDVIVAVDVQGLSYEETAQRLGISQGTVKSRASRARAKLAVLLGHLQDDDP